MPGRHKASAPRGRVTLEQAAELSGLSKPTVHRRVVDGEVSAQRGEDGSWTIARRDVRLLKHREPSAGDAAGRRPIQLRPQIARHGAWERAARAAGYERVSTWIGSLADRASGYSEPDED